MVVSALALSASSAPRTSLPLGIVAESKFPRPTAAALTPSKARRSVSSAVSAVVRCWTSVEMASERFSNASVAVGVLARWGLSKKSVAAFSAMPSTPLIAVLRFASAAVRSFVSVSRLVVVVSALALSASSAPRTSLPLGIVAESKFPRPTAAALTPSKARRSVSSAVSAVVRCWTSVEMASERFSNASVAVGVLARWGLSKKSVAAFSAMPSTPLIAVLRFASAAVRSFVSVSRLAVVVSAFALSASSAPWTSLPSGMVAVSKLPRWLASPPTPSKVRRLVLS